MLQIIDSQSTGKTRKLLAYAKDNNCVVICSFPERMKDKAIRYGLGNIDCISYYEFLNQYRDNTVPDGNYVVDELEKFYSAMFVKNVHLCGYNITIENDALNTASQAI